ncbi:MAG: UV DNA damage repair endonuclease UvsE [Candidatus Hodarchaeota archaeon]
MKVGYPCINLSLDCRSSRTFRLRNYSTEKISEIIDTNLNCLKLILDFNINNKILFFRITSDLIPFASHPIMNFDWQDFFKSRFIEIGKIIKENNMRISMHPGQYTVLNSKNEDVFERSLKELRYHVDVLDLMELYPDAKVMTHIGGAYNDKEASIARFIERYHQLDSNIKERYVIENDDKIYTIDNCLKINEETGIPIILDIYHHECNNPGYDIIQALKKIIKTWNEKDGIPIVHYSSEHPIKGKCRHADSIDLNHFKRFLEKTKEYDFDVMIEIKDKEKSLLAAKDIIFNDIRFKKVIDNN